jgi:DNA-binding PadR family transcriptional regulator
MSLQHALLGLLAVAPGSGYDLAKEFERDLGRYAWQAGHTSIYPELNRMAERGLVEVSESGPRGRRTYDITDAGRSELRDWLFKPRQSPTVRNELVLRMFLLSALDTADALTLLHAIADDSAAKAAELRAAISRPTEGKGARAGFGMLAGEFGIRQHDAVHEWALWAIDQLNPPAADRATGTAGDTTGDHRSGATGRPPRGYRRHVASQQSEAHRGRGTSRHRSRRRRRGRFRVRLGP